MSDLWTHIAAIFIGVVITLYIAQKVAEANQAAAEAVKQSSSTSTAMVSNPTTRSGGTAASVRRPSVRRPSVRRQHYHQYNVHNTNNVINNDNRIYHNNNAIVNNNTASFTRAGASLAEAAAVYGSGPGLNPPESVEEETTADPAAGLLPVTSVAAEGEESPSPDEKVTREMVAACEYTRRRGEGLALRRQERAQARVDAKRVIDQQSCAMRRKKKRLLSQQQQQDKYPSKRDLAGLTNREKQKIFQGYWSKNTKFL